MGQWKEISLSLKLFFNNFFRTHHQVWDTAKAARLEQNNQTCQCNTFLHRKPMRNVMQKCVLCERPLTQHEKQNRSRMERQTLRGWIWIGWGRQVEAYRLHGLEWSCVNVDATVKGFGDRLKHLGLRGRGGGLLRRQGHGDLGCISYITHISKPKCTQSICETTAVCAVTCRGSMASVCGRGSELWGGW